jgi:carboxyl-terminal processing protease
MARLQRWSTVGGFALGVVSTLALVAATQAWGGLRAGTGSLGLSRSGFDEALDAILDKHVEPVDRAELLSRGLHAMVQGLDDHSRFLTAQERRLLSDRAQGGTTGLSVAFRPNHRSGPAGHPSDASLQIVGVVPGSPAADAGLQPGDRVDTIGSQLVAELSQAEVDAALLGKPGDEVSLAVRGEAPGSTERKVQLKLESTARRVVETHFITTESGDKIGCIAVHAFRSESGLQVKRAFADLTRRAGKKGLAGLVLDLRSNPGGEVDQALIVADMFVGDGVLTRTRGRDGRVLREEVAHDKGTNADIPIAVLVDSHTASAAELLAAALRDHGRGTLLGTQTYGKGTVQQVLGLPDGSVLTLTIARYYSPKDERIDGVGLAPDTAVQWSKLSRDAAVREVLAAFGQRPA